MAESKPTLEAKDFIEAKTSKDLFSIMNTKGISSPKVLDVLAYEKQLRAEKAGLDVGLSAYSVSL